MKIELTWKGIDGVGGGDAAPMIKNVCTAQ